MKLHQSGLHKTADMRQIENLFFKKILHKTYIPHIYLMYYKTHNACTSKPTMQKKKFLKNHCSHVKITYLYVFLVWQGNIFSCKHCTVWYSLSSMV